MIYDRIENLNQYGIDLNFVLTDLQNNHFDKGIFEIVDEGCYGICLEYETKLSVNGLWEAHRKYLDIHVVLEGKELVEISDINSSISIKEYEDDYELFESKAKHEILLEPGYFLILFPHEVHKTGILVESVELIKKKVFKRLLSTI